MADDLNHWRKRLDLARRDREEKIESVHEATRGLAQLTRAAKDAGLPVTEIAQIVGVTRKSIYSLWEREG